MPNVRCGTCWMFSSHTTARVNEPPMLMLCEPLIQLRVFSTSRVPASRAEYALEPEALLIPAALMPSQ
jgi:hypothetical protein